MLENIIVTSIERPITVCSPKGRHAETKNRSSYGLSFCMNGQITYIHRGKRYVSSNNNAILLPKGQTYSLVGDKEGFFPVINFDCEGIACEDITIFPLQNAEPYFKDYEKIKELFLFPDKQLQVFSIFYGMLQRIIQEQNLQNNTLQQALKYIETNIASSDLSNTQIAQNSNISEVYLRKLFVQKYHTSPKQYILDIRIQKAKQLLTDSFHTASTIAELCGFSSLYSFSRCFKEKVGVSPTEYAKKNRVYKI